MFLYSMKKEASLPANQGNQVMIPKRQFFQIVKSLRLYKIRNKEVWSYMVKSFVTLMNLRSLSQQELVEAVINFHLMKVSSQKLFEFIVTYQNIQGFDHNSLIPLRQERVLIYFECLSKWYYELNNEKFFNSVDNYIKMNILKFDQSELKRLLDLLKLNRNFYSEQTRQLVESKIE